MVSYGAESTAMLGYGAHALRTQKNAENIRDPLQGTIPTLY